MNPVSSITVRVPLAIRRCPGRKTVVTPNGETATLVRAKAYPTLIKALARAFRWQKLLDEGRYASISELALAEKIERGFLGKMLRLTLLAPDLVEAIMDGRMATGVTLPKLMAESHLVWTGTIEHHGVCFGFLPAGASLPEVEGSGRGKATSEPTDGGR